MSKIQIHGRPMFRTIDIDYEGYKIAAYAAGEGDEAILLVNGGPGLGSQYLRKPHAELARRGFKVYAYDQLGCGRSDRPDDNSLWTVERYAKELEHVRKSLGLNDFHLYGQSWGAVLSIEYALTYPHAFKSLIISGGVADVPFFIEELGRLRNALGSETVAMMMRHEAEGTTDHPEYEAAVTLLNYRHMCRLDKWPDALNESIAGWNQKVYNVMQGTNEFVCTGNLRKWSRLDDLHQIKQRALVISGQHDHLTPANALKIHQALPNAQIKIFKNSSHMPFFEEPDSYFALLEGFLRQ